MLRSLACFEYAPNFYKIAVATFVPRCLVRSSLEAEGAVLRGNDLEASSFVAAGDRTTQPAASFPPPTEVTKP